MESTRPLSPDETLARARQRARRRGLVVFAALALLLHAALLGSIDGAGLGADRTPAAGAPMSVRSIDAKAQADDADPAAAAETPPAAALPVRRPPPKPRRARSTNAPSVVAAASAAPPPESAASEPVFASADAESASASASASAPSTSESVAEALLASSPAASVPGAAVTAASATTPATASSNALAAAAPASAASATFLTAGEAPPPTYRTKLPPSVTLSYEVRRGFLRGTGEIRWQHVGDDYGLRLEARIAGLTLLAQTSQGVVDATGIAPVRFLDQRARRAPQAANFRRDGDSITFSGPATVWPLLPGTQDQLSWMIQLAGIVAADPEQARSGARISMVIVGARGDASVRTLRFVGAEDATTASGTVPALKFVVEARSTYDSTYEIWLDPAHDYLPAHATQRNGAGESQFDLLLERIEPIS